MDRAMRTKEILSELRDLWQRKADIELREAELEAELAGEASSAGSAALPKKRKFAEVDWSRMPKPAKVEPVEKADRKQLLLESRSRVLARLRPSADVLADLKNSVRAATRSVGRKFGIGELSREIGAEQYKDEVLKICLAMTDNGELRRLRGRQFLSLGEEPSGDGTDALDRETVPLDDLSVPPDQDEIGELDVLG